MCDPSGTSLFLFHDTIPKLVCPHHIASIPYSSPPTNVCTTTDKMTNRLGFHFFIEERDEGDVTCRYSNMDQQHGHIIPLISHKQIMLTMSVHFPPLPWTQKLNTTTTWHPCSFTFPKRTPFRTLPNRSSCTFFLVFRYGQPKNMEDRQGGREREKHQSREPKKSVLWVDRRDKPNWHPL